MKRRSLIVFFLVISILLGACEDKSKISDGKAVNIYYIDSKTSVLVTEQYELISSKIEDQIHELLYNLQKTPENAVYKSALPSNEKDAQGSEINFTFDTYTGYLTVDFTSSYDNLSKLAMVLCQAAIVKTLSQVEGVQFIQFSKNGQSIKEAAGIYTADYFIENIEDSTIYKVKLYFANEEGDALVEYTTEINYTGIQSIEDMVIRQLINGPTEVGMYHTIPEGTVLLNLSKADGICTVDFNKEFLNKLPKIKEEIVIYSIVNTLVELPDIDKVQFTIESEVQKTYWKDFPLNEVYDENLNLVDGTS